MFVNDLFKLIENSNEEYYAVYNQRGRPMIMRKPAGKTAEAYAEEKNLTIKGGPFGSHQETESFWIRSVLPGKDKKVDEDRFDKDDRTVRLPPHMTGRDPSKPSVDIPGTPYTVSMRGDDAMTQQDARHFGRYLASVPNPITKAAGMVSQYVGQYDRLPTGEKVARAMDSAGAPSVDRMLRKPMKEQDIDEAGPFSYGAKKPRKGSVADLAAQKRKEQEKGRQPVEPKDQRVGVAKVTKGVAEEEGDVSAPSDAYLNSQSFKQQQERDIQRIAEPKKISSSSTGGTIYKTDKGTIHRAGHPASLNIGDVSQYGVNGPYEPKYSGAERSSRAPDYDQKSLTPDHPRFKGGNATRLPQTGTGGGPRGGGSSPSGGGMMDPFGGKKRSLYFEKKSTNEGSVQDKLHQRHQELRKKRGAPDPEYYKQLGKSYDIENDQERYARQAEIKKKYGVTNEDRERYVEELGRAGYEIVTESATLCPECGGAAYSDRMLAEKQDACYHKVKSRYKVWPSAYASGALVKCRKKGAANWGNKSKK